MKKIVYVFDAGDWDSRMAVAQKAKAEGFDITLALICRDPDILKQRNTEFKVIPIIKGGHNIGIFSAMKMMRDVHTLVKQEKPDIIHVVTLKYSFIIGLATLLHGNLKKIYTLAGLGYLFRSDDAKSKLLQALLSPFLKFVLRRNDTYLIFQNPDDTALMVNAGYAKKEHCYLIRGSGVYLDHFKPLPSSTDQTPIVLMPTRLVHEKGIGVFIEAARILKQQGMNAVFQIAGGETRHNPKAISRTKMEEMTKCGTVEWLGRVENMPALLSQVHLVVYPSYYGEGIPRVLLEACAAGRAIVTTDHPGCREAVRHEHNGLLVPIKNPQATADAIRRVLQDSDMRSGMEKESRKHAENHFDIHSIASQTVTIYQK